MLEFFHTPTSQKKKIKNKVLSLVLSSLHKKQALLADSGKNVLRSFIIY